MSHLVFRAVREERGVVLVVTLGAILILSILIAILVYATIGEIAISRSQLAGTQALFLAEAGAYRALAELRHRLTVDLEANIGRARPTDIIGPCESNQGWRVVAEFAHNGTESDWVQNEAADEAVLRLTQGTPLPVLARDGREIGRFAAIIRVRSVAPGVRPSVCQHGSPTAPESYRMFLDYEVQATGVTRGARRAVQLTNLPAVPLQLVVEQASFSRWALLLLRTSEMWLTDSTLIDGPAHTNGHWWISGSPTFDGPVSSADARVRFDNCGSPLELEAVVNPGFGPACPGDRPNYLRGELERGARLVEFPATPPNLARSALGLEPGEASPSDDEIFKAVADKEAPREGIPPGIYIANDADILRHPRTYRSVGIYVKGRVGILALVIEGDKQVIMIQMADATPGRSTMTKIILAPEEETIRVEPDADSGRGRTYRGKLNGLIYVDGAIESLSGTVHRHSQLTIAARESITITGHIVYQDPPSDLPEHSSSNLLGVYAETGSIEIDGMEAPVDLYIDAVMLAPNGKFWVKRLDVTPDKGTIRVFGGLTEANLVELGKIDPRTRTWRGYHLKLRYDQRLLGQLTPPFFPRANRYSTLLGPIGLYEKPIWLEIPVP